MPNMGHGLAKELLEKKLANIKSIAILIDPDDEWTKIKEIIDVAIINKVDYFFVGGSIITNDCLEKTIGYMKEKSEIPVYLFPGNELQLNNKADGILLLSLVSGRNPDFLIGKHVLAAPYLYKSNLDIVPTGYLLIDGGKPSSVAYMSNTTPIPNDKNDIALATALAAQFIGNNLVYLDAGSGAINCVSNSMIEAIRSRIDIPIIVGGGLKDIDTIKSKFSAGADVIVVGNAVAENKFIIESLVGYKKN